MTNVKKLGVLDLFSGAGGFSLGFQKAGCQILGAIEFDKWAADTFEFNHKGSKVLLGDIRKFSNEFIAKEIKKKPDIIIGGPPCQGFSICTKNAGDPKDPRNSLFIEFVRIAKYFMPSIIVMENVPNIMNAKTKKGEMVVDIIEAEFSSLGYNVNKKILTASDYGVPQRRQRFVLVATKKKIKQPFPQKKYITEEEKKSFLPLVDGDISKLKDCPTLWDAISDLPDIEACEGAEEMEYTHEAKNDFQKLCREGASKLYNHLAMKHTKRVVERFKLMKWGESVSDITDERFKQRKRNGNGIVSDKPYDQNNRRMHPDRICNTITAAFYGNFVHPYKNRNFTAREGARIQSFPDSYVFLGKPTVVSKKLLEREGRKGEAFLCQYSQIGNAVPPLMAQAIAENIIRQIKE